MSGHIPVLRDEAVAGMQLSPNAIVVDCTLGGGGHAEAILATLGDDGTYVGIDVDPVAVSAGKNLALRYSAHIHTLCGNFRDIKRLVHEAHVGTPTAILADLGWRSDQFAESGKGFSFNAEEPLQMTFGDPTLYPFTAHDIANEWEEESIADIVYGYGEERGARRIARAIVEARSAGPIETSKQLADIVVASLPASQRSRRIHPATKTFQAFRIAVNDELGALKDLLTDGFDLLAPGGRMAIITFHSLEDRIVKQYFTTLAREHTAIKITKKPITATRAEITENPRARSAKLRIIEKSAL